MPQRAGGCRASSLAALAMGGAAVARRPVAARSAGTRTACCRRPCCWILIAAGIAIYGLLLVLFGVIGWSDMRAALMRSRSGDLRA